MKMTHALRIGFLIVGAFLSGKLQAADGRFIDYRILATPADQLVLAANEVAIIDETVAFDSSYNWVNILYQRETNDVVNLALPLGLTDGTMPLAGPAVIMLNTNDADFFGAEYTGAVGFKVLRQKSVERYVTLAYPADKLVLAANEKAMVIGSASFDWSYNWQNLLYKQGTNDFIDLEVALEWPDPISLPGPGVIMLNTNDVFVYGAEYTGAIGLKIVHNPPGKKR